MPVIFSSFVRTLFFVSIFFFFSVPESYGANEEDLRAQLTALQSYITRTYVPASKSLTESELRASVLAGAAWIKESQEANGHFRYEYVPYEEKYLSGDNIVRQAGTLYSLGEILRRSDADHEDVEETMENSISYLENMSEEDEVNGTPFRCVPRGPTIARCPLGATALALIALLSYIEAVPEEENEYESLINDYLAYILSAQKSNGGFRNNHELERSLQSDAESAFSNGEALLALVRYYEYKEGREVREAIDAALSHLKAQPYDANLYLWMMAALRDMHNLWPNDEYIAYAKAFTDWRLQRAAVINTANRNYCPYAEGLASALTLLRGNVSVSEEAGLRKELDLRNRKNFGFQITKNDTYRLLPTEKGLMLKPLILPERALGGFLTSDSVPTQRIDFTQHCITTYVQTLVDLQGKNL